MCASKKFIKFSQLSLVEVKKDDAYTKWPVLDLDLSIYSKIQN